MLTNRRNLLKFAATALAAATTPRIFAAGLPPVAGIRAIAFDAFPILDPRSIAAACERAFPGRGPELMNLWRARQFEYQWLRALGGRYEDFWKTTADALAFACDSLKLKATAAQRDELMQEYLRLGVWPDVPASLRLLRQRGLKIAFLSNATAGILEGAVRRAGLESSFDHVISTDRIRSFKPDPRAYRLGLDVLGLAREQILFVAFAGWDVAGAKWFGYPTFWNNRQDVAPEQLDAAPDARGATLTDVVEFLGA